MEVIIATFLHASATVDFLTASNNDYPASRGYIFAV